MTLLLLHGVKFGHPLFGHHVDIMLSTWLLWLDMG